MHDAITAAIAADVPVLLWGAPGTGKSAAIAALATDRGAHIETLIGSTLDPSDIARPVVRDDGDVHLSAAPWARRLRAALDDGREAWLFLDELSTAPPAVQAALLRVVQERCVGELSLAGCRVLAAANPVEQSAAGWDLSAATANRWLHVDWTPDADAWIAGQLGGWGGGTPGATLVASWISTRGLTTLLSCPDDDALAGRGWPSPRSWTHVGRVLDALPGTAREAALSAAGAECVRGLVGPAAAEFAQWVAAQDLADPRDLLDGRASLADRGDRQWAEIDGAISLAIRERRLSDLWVLLDTARPDVALSAARRATAAAAAAKLAVEPHPVLTRLVSVLRGTQ